MKIHASGEDYLEAILVLQKKMGMVRSIDLARHMGFSKPSISHAVSVLKNGGFLTVDDDGFLHLTAIGREAGQIRPGGEKYPHPPGNHLLCRAARPRGRGRLCSGLFLIQISTVKFI